VVLSCILNLQQCSRKLLPVCEGSDWFPAVAKLGDALLNGGVKRLAFLLLSTNFNPPSQS